MVSGAVADLWIPGMFWTQDLKSFTVCFALGIVHITEKSSGSEREEKCSRFTLKSQKGERKLPYRHFGFFLPFYSCGIHGSKRCLTLILSRENECLLYGPDISE